MTMSEAEIGTLSINMYDDERLSTDPWGFLDSLRRQHRVVKLDPGADDGDDVYLALGYDEVKELFQRSDLFSNHWMYLYLPRGPRMLGIEDMDPPEHTPIRRLLNPLFTLQAMQRWDGRIREICRSLIDGFKDDGHCDVMSDFTQKIPGTLILEMFGIPSRDMDRMLDLCYRLVHPDPINDPDNSKLLVAAGEIDAYVKAMIADRRKHRGDDMVSQIVWALDQNSDISDEDLSGNLKLILAAGLDTVANSLGAYLLHLSRDDSLRAAVIADPSVIPQVVEELLRLYGVAIPVRTAKQDMDFFGCPLKAGDRIGATTLSANRDETVFEGGSACDYTREGNKHLTFGAGTHRCIGSHLARLELVIALDEWHKAIPHYWVEAQEGIKMHSGHMTGYVTLPVRWR